MLTLVTGVPGAGKTLYALGLAEEYRASGRTVYHNGISGLTLPWELLPEGSSWTSCPDGSVVLLDEAQQIWRVRPQGSRVPEDVAALETHRHRGFDLILTTQSPGLIDVNVRKLVGRHFHLTRKFGREKVGLYRWEHCESSPESSTAQRQAHKEMWAFPAERFGWYQSAVLHTHKKQFPWRLVAMLGGGLAAVAALVGFAFWQLGSAARDSAPLADVPASGPAQPRRASMGDPWSAERRSPRVAGYAESAPYYDALFVAPRSAPQIAGCMMVEYGRGEMSCDCFTDQGVRLDVPLPACRDWMRYGSHDILKGPQDQNADVIARLNARAANAIATGAGVAGYGGEARASPAAPAAESGSGLQEP